MPVKSLVGEAGFENAVIGKASGLVTKLHSPVPTPGTFPASVVVIPQAS